MILLEINPLVQPEIGLIFWTSIVFICLLVVLRKFAWKPLVKALDERERSIEEALFAAEKARTELVHLNQQSEKLLFEAGLQRDKLISGAKALKEDLIKEATQKAQLEGLRLVAQAKAEIAQQSEAIQASMRQQVAVLSVSIAEKILHKQLAGTAETDVFMADLLKELKIQFSEIAA